MSDWYFSEADDRLIRPEQIVQLTPKASAVLACLRRHKGEVVGTETFLSEVWPGLHVTPDLVREYIHDLRAALGDEARQPRFIETVRGKGFRLIGDIGEATAELMQSKSVPRDRNGLPTVAVLKPVTNGNAEINEIADAVASDIINHLARFHYVGVVARQSSFSPTEVNDIRSFARDVQASYVLESNFARLGGVIRARVQLVDARSGTNLWGERIDLDGADPLAVVDQIANTVVLALTGWHGELHRAEFQSVSRKRDAQLTAFEHFILGCDLEMQLDAESLPRSLMHLERSIQLDPTFSRAWLVYAFMLRACYAVMPGRDLSYLQRSKEAVETAFKLAPKDPVNLAFTAMQTARQGNLASALGMLDRAEASLEGDFDAMVCVSTAKAALTEDVAGAVALFERALEDNPAPPSWYYFSEAGIAFMAEQHERCITASRFGPQELSAAVFRCLSYATLERETEARAAHDQLMATFPRADLRRFPKNFPILDPARRQAYDTALHRLETILDRQSEKTVAS